MPAENNRESRDTPYIEIASPALEKTPESGFHTKLRSAGRMSKKYSGPGGAAPNTLSPPMTWSGVPNGAKSLAIAFDDPDAAYIMKLNRIPGNAWIHWLAANLSPGLSGIPENFAHTLPADVISGINNFGQVDYGGPAPPSDYPPGFAKPIVHIYSFRLYALSETLRLKPGFTIDEFNKAIHGKVIASGELLFSYSN